MMSETQCSMPQWVRDELARRESYVRDLYRRTIAGRTTLMSEEEYVANALRIWNLNQPLTWTTCGLQEEPKV